ncbi:DUF922 domain-containing Zn-dependent protease [Geobacter sp. DSM 9736]|uniref:DUF922 domain-containing Zn-dependent protease n=1 Tax=Geobacter sp. DSM 9736 TaxID=1277350 RepID=UPI000B50D466|nr:DUF922 domain-containing Zn-dependent protease [Geobacter sp. DSM 9736]SNB46778.1 Predicted secreted Zn-dependent protease [Geobacter sp. DSM 9736]
MIRFLVAAIALTSLLSTSPASADQNPAERPVTLAKLSDPDPGQPIRKFDARTELREKYEFYDITGSSAKELRRQMTLNGIPWDDGQTYDALATWEIKYRYNTATDNGACYVTSAKTDVGVVYRFPRWKDASGADSQLTSRWNTYMEHLRTHEFGHKDLAVATAQEISEGLSSLGSFRNCSDLEKAVKSMAQAKLVRLKETQREYDATTRHGETQGAFFP